MTAEILSIIAVCISGVTAVCSATIPAILNYKAKKAELKAQKTREQEQTDNAKFEVFYQTHLKILKDFSNLYEDWKTNPKNNSEILEFIHKVAPEFRYSTSRHLYELANKIVNYKTGDELDEDYERCRRIILQCYGVRVSGSTPDYLMSEILKVVLKERFNELQKASSKDFHFYRC